MAPFMTHDEREIRELIAHKRRQGVCSPSVEEITRAWRAAGRRGKRLEWPTALREVRFVMTGRAQ